MSTISGVSSNSQSTGTSRRRRHAGAAKTRLARAKEADKGFASWHESMQAAAASADRVWEPKKGWVDYKSQQKEMENFQEIAEPKATPKIHIPIHIAAKTSSRKGNSTDDGTTHEITTAAVAQNQESKPIAAPQNMAKPNAKKANDRKTTQTSKAVNSSKTPRESLVHSQPIPPKSHEPSESAEDPCWPHPSRRKESDSMRPLLISQTSKAENRRGTPPRRKQPLSEPPKSHMKEKEENNPQRGRTSPLRKAKTSAPNNPLVPLKIERISQPPTIPPSKRDRVGQSVSPKRRRGPKQSATSESPSSPLKPGRWIASMRRATANLAKDGHHWDPQHGFANLETADVDSIQPSVRKSGNVPATGAKPQQNHQISLQTKQESPADVLGMMIAERRKNDPPGRKESTRTSLKVSSIHLLEEEEDNPDPPQTPLQKEPDPIAKYQSRQTPDANRDDENRSSFQEQIEVVMVSSVASAAPALNFEEDEDYYLLRAPVTPNVLVKKERVSQGEFGFFPSAKRGSAQYGPPVVSPEVQEASSVQRKTSKRSSGPIDVDEVDNLSVASSETTEVSNVWDAQMFENDSFLQGSISPPRRLDQAAEGQKNSEGHASRTQLQEQRSAQVADVERQENKPGTCSNGKESGYSSLREIINRRATKQTDVKDQRPDNTKANITALSGKPTEKPGILKTRARKVPSEIATDDASSQVSTPSAGWISYMHKKVSKEKESAAAALQQQEEKTQNEEQKIKKTVSFASDLMSDSLLDSLFDFSASNASGLSPARAAAVKPPHPRSPKNNNRWAESRARLASPQYRGDRLFPNNNSDNQPSATRLQSEEEKDPLGRGAESGSGMPLELPPRRIHRSFGELTDLSPLTTQNEEKEAYVQDEPQPTFLQRLAECRAPAGHPRGAAGRQQSPNDSEEASFARQWYLQSRQASERVEDLMQFLKDKRFASCQSIRQANPENGDKGRAALDHETKTEMNNPESDAHKLARARVEAMVETLYYAS